MNVNEAISQRRAYRSFKHVEITQDLLDKLATAASLAPSCYNKQPWRFVAVYDKEILDQVHQALPKGNQWATEASLIIAVCSQKELDCVIGEREYFLFDTGLATANLLLQATELGLVAHPFAGYKPELIAEVLAIPADLTVIALVAVGVRGDTISPNLSEAQIRDEQQRPPRLDHDKFFFNNRYGG